MMFDNIKFSWTIRLLREERIELSRHSPDSVVHVGSWDFQSKLYVFPVFLERRSVFNETRSLNIGSLVFRQRIEGRTQIHDLLSEAGVEIQMLGMSWFCF